MTDQIKGKVVVITGASSGLAEASARLLSANGAIVVPGARRKDRIDRLAADIMNAGGKVLAVATDVTKEADVLNLVEAAIGNDVIINNAGLMPHSLLERGKTSDWDQMIDVNLKGVLCGIAAVLPDMIRCKAGNMINVSSVAGHKVLLAVCLFCNKNCRTRDLRRLAPGNEAIWHARYRDLPGCSRYCIAGKRHRT